MQEFTINSLIYWERRETNCRNTVDSGPISAPWSGSSSGTADGVWDVLGYNGWTLAVKFSGTSGEAVSAKLQMSVIGSGESTWVDQQPYADFSGTSWNYYTTNYHVRYARIFGQNTSATDSGALIVCTCLDRMKS